MGDTYQLNIEPGDWRPVLVGPQVADLTARDDFDWVYAAAAPTDPRLDGHFGAACDTLRVTPAAGQAVFVRNRLRLVRLTVTPGVYDVDQPPPDPEPALRAPSGIAVTVAPGTADVGDTLTATITGDLGYPAGAATIVWLCDGAQIPGETAATYLIGLPGAITCAVDVANPVGNDAAASAAVDVPALYEPAWADNNGASALALDGVLAADSAYLERFLHLRGLEATSGTGNPRLREVAGRSAMFFQSDGDLQMYLKNASNETLVEWHSNGVPFNVAGEWLIHLHAALVDDATHDPTFEVRRLRRDVPSPAWETVPGAFITAPIAGLINHSRSTGGNDHALLGNVGGTLFVDCQIAACWESQAAAQVGHDAFWNNGRLRDPAGIGAPTVLLRPPAATLGANEGSGADWIRIGAGFSDVVDGADPLPDLLPVAMVGFGAAATGGRGGKVVRVTSLSESAGTTGSIRWALAQHAGQPLTVLFCVEGKCQLTSPLAMNRANVTFDNRFSPGAGYWFEGDRVEILASNVIWHDLKHHGNELAYDDNSDCFKIGIYSTDPASTALVENVYIDGLCVSGSSDETFAFTTRPNGLATGSRVRNVTIRRPISTDPSNINQNHGFGPIIGDGCTNITIIDGLLSNAQARYPYVKQYGAVECINLWLYNFKENCMEFEGAAQVHVLGCNFKLGPRSVGTIRPIRFQTAATGRAWIDDCIVTNGSATLVHNAGTVETAAIFAPSGVARVPAADVPARLASLLQFRGYGGVPRAFEAAVIAEAQNNTGPSAVLATLPGEAPVVTGATYPAANAAGVPLGYLALYPDRADPAALILSGPWAGHSVAEHLAAWLGSAHYAAA